ncbi:MAG: aminoacetone oxidase family FAD-binding enzyme [Phycisphaerae bacterium]|jgi:hypothetical protein
MNEHCDIAVVGAGAAGLAAAIWAAQTLKGRGGDPGAAGRVVVLNGSAPPAAKLLISGGGRCNLTNANLKPADFNGSPNIIRNILAGFDVPATVAWFESLGIRLAAEEDGKLFPAAGDARSVVSSLLGRCKELSIPIQSNCRVESVVAGQAAAAPAFAIAHAQGTLEARRVIIATGGRSLASTGSDGGGWDIARSLGHSVSPVLPALAPLVLEASFFHPLLSGLSLAVELSTYAGGKCVDRRVGQMLWTHFGVSGPVVLSASRHILAARALDAAGAELRCSLLPGMSFADVEQWLIARASGDPLRGIAGVLAEKLPTRLAGVLMLHCGIDKDIKIGQWPRQPRRELVHTLTGLVLPAVGDRGWDYAELTAGGVPLDEINYRTMESRKVPGLHLAGEMLDCDGPVGGFNLQWAWSTGKLAGVAAARATD